MEFPRKFLSLRDKSGSPSRSRGRENKEKKENKARPLSTRFSSSSRPLSAEAIKTDHSKRAELEAAKIEDVQRRLDGLNITNVSIEHIRDIMATLYADGDPARTTEFIDMEQKASAGDIIPYDPKVDMVGAENRSAVTCYLDSLLFAMFAKLDAFECMLKAEFPPDDPRSKLVNLLRIWVTMLRTGKLIRTDFTKLLQDALADCGWQDARLLEQQDTSEAFAFLTETLQLPLLSLQVDLFHHGKKDDDDHKIVYERLLNLAVPLDPDGKGVKLEDCLEEYFNAQVDVLRDSEVGKRSLSEDQLSVTSSPMLHKSTIRLIRGEEHIATPSLSASPVEINPSISSLKWRDGSSSSQMSDLSRSVSHNDAVDSSSRSDSESPNTSSTSPRSRSRSKSLIQRVLLDDQGRPTGSDDNLAARRAMRKGSSVVKAVTIPAWQFFRLIPWHSIEGQEPRSTSEVAMNFDQRPVVGICLKRYAMTASGHPKRLNTFIDIPDSLRLPHFMLADGPNMQEVSHGLNTEYKLVLQSIVCHRGDSLQSGHYIAFARVAPKLLTDNRRHNVDPPPDYEEAQWVKFDDFDLDRRVRFVKDFRKDLKSEMPYLLFYQVVPMKDGPRASSEEGELEPPSYDESRASADVSRLGTSDGPVSGLEKCFENVMAEISRFGESKTPSIRLSEEIEAHSRRILEGVGSGSSNETRRYSVTFSDAAPTPDGHSPVFAPEDEPPQASRLSRAASRFALSGRSRPVSQSGEGRLSSTMTRLGFMRSSREPLVEPNGLITSATLAIGELGAESRKWTSEEDKGSRPSTPKVKNKSRAKDKVKQPDRECSLM